MHCCHSAGCIQPMAKLETAAVIVLLLLLHPACIVARLPQSTHLSSIKSRTGTLNHSSSSDAISAAEHQSSSMNRLAGSKAITSNNAESAADDMFQGAGLGSFDQILADLISQLDVTQQYMQKLQQQQWMQVLQLGLQQITSAAPPSSSPVWVLLADDDLENNSTRNSTTNSRNSQILAMHVNRMVSILWAISVCAISIVRTAIHLFQLLDKSMGSGIITVDALLILSLIDLAAELGSNMSFLLVGANGLAALATTPLQDLGWRAGTALPEEL